MSDAALALRSVTKRFGGLTAVNAVDFTMPRGAIAAVIGPNGAGKTTLFNLITGVYRPSAGDMTFEGTPLARPLDRATLLLGAGVAVATALLALALVAGPSTFAALVAGYRYGQPFAWDAGVAAAGAALASRALLLVVAGVAGGAAGGAGFAVTWSRTRQRPHRLAWKGFGRTFQNIRLFQHMTVLGNVLVGQHPHLRAGFWAALVRTPAQQAEESRARAEGLSLLAYVGIADRADTLARNLPYGDQRRLEIARALALKPRILLLDEPTSGMNPRETDGLMRLIRDIRERYGLTILLIEHHMKVVMGISDQVTVLDHGAKIADGTPQGVAKDPAVIEAYLGATETEIE